LLPSIALSIVVVTMLSALLQQLLSLHPLYPLKAAVLAALAAAVLVRFAMKHLDSTWLVSANLVTLMRAGVTVILIAALSETPSHALAWVVTITASIALTLDGLDGWLARSRGSVSRFGARFDMETDALLICTVAAIAWQHEKAGIWILAGGLMRYVFVASSYVLPWMQRALPDSRRRKVICVAQTVSLVLCLAPFTPTGLSDAIALIGLALLATSFAIDVAWLRRVATT
jgi:phosphatidylglycerophosphate synthase